MPAQKTVIPYCIALYKLLKKEKYDVVHIHKNSCANPMAIIVSKMSKVPKIIIHSHNTAAVGGRHLHGFHYLFRPIVRKIADEKIACSKEAGEWLFGKKSTFTEIKNGIDTDKFAFSESKREQIRKELKLDNKFVIGHVGHYIPQKNHRFIIDIMAEVIKNHKDSVLMLIGRGDAMKEIREYARSRGVLENVMFLGARPDVDKLYSAMDVFLFPSLHEGLPIAGVEAQCSDLPCLFSDSISSQIGIIDKATFISLENNAEYWSKELIKWQGNIRRNKKEEIIQCGYDAENTARKMEQLYL